jgi:hypothetical protein
MRQDDVRQTGYSLGTPVAEFGHERSSKAGSAILSSYAGYFRRRILDLYGKDPK